MLGKERLPDGAVGQAAWNPADMVKARLPESQSPAVNVNTRRKQRLTTAAGPCDRLNRRTDAPSRARALACAAKQGDEWGT
ncbi:MAG: hypothetical protein ACRDI2_09435 [Chloroflexota bacterium]